MTGIIDESTHTHNIRLETPRLVLREHRPEDLEPLHAILSDAAVTWYLPGMRKETLEETEASRAALDFIFGINACRVSASCLAENLGSRRVAEKCGMTQEGLLKAHTWHDGRWKDCAVYRLLREEWEA